MKFNMNQKNKAMVEDFLHEVDKSFPIPLSEKQNLEKFATKLCDKATLCMKLESDRIVSMVGGYTEDVMENKAYISIVATCADAWGKGYASKLVKEFIDISREKGLDAVHLYAVPSNERAIDMYKRIGFQELHMLYDTRPEDMHLIYYINK